MCGGTREALIEGQMRSMTTSLARLDGIQSIKVGNVLGGRTVGVRGALLHARGTSLHGMATKVGGQTLL